MRADYQELQKDKKVLVTGAAGFIGFHLSQLLLEKGIKVIGYDNINDYYDIGLKYTRLNILKKYDTFEFVQGDLTDMDALGKVFKVYHPDIVVNLAAQAGVRYSIEKPLVYMQSNIMGFFNILECCRNYPVMHLLYASSSSVYGGNTKIPFSTSDNVDKPVSLYAATKKSNELMAHAYCKLYNISCTGLRFFTVYGPLGRPDMAYFSFSQKIMKGEPIKVFNNGDLYRDFTYIDDIVEAISRMLMNPPLLNEEGIPYKIYNIGNNKPEKLMDFIQTLENVLGKEAVKEYYPMQPGDVYQTYADITDLEKDFEFRPRSTIAEGLGKFAIWFKEYYNF